MSGNKILITDRNSYNRDSYSDVLLAYLPQPIKTEADNERAIAQLEALLHQESLTAAEEDLSELLGQLIERFESEQHAFSVEDGVTPLDVLLSLVEGNDLKQADLVGIIGSKGVVSEVVNGKREINKKMALALAQRFNVEASLFLA
jgi:HTH-type transcriptional regulator / antitoxin HigA